LWSEEGAVAVALVLLLVLVQSFIWVICCTRSLGNGMVIGFAGWVWGVALTLLLVLPHRVFNRLGVLGLEFDRGNRNAVEEEDQVDAVLVVQRVAHLTDDSQAVGIVMGQDFCV